MNIFQTLLTQPLANGLIVFYRLLGNNLGLAIIVFGLALRAVLGLMTKSSMEQMNKIRELNPKLEKLRKKYKNDKVKLAQAQSDLYKAKGINPGAGCLPQILQFAVLIAFFGVFSKTLSAEGGTTEAFNKLLYTSLKFSGGQTINSHFLIWDLSKPDIFHLSFVSFALPGILVILSTVFQLFASKIMMPYERAQEVEAKKTASSTDDFQVAMQKSMIYMLPLITLTAGVKFPSGLALYWLVISVYQAYQQHTIHGWGGMTPWLIKLNLIKSDGK